MLFRSAYTILLSKKNLGLSIRPLGGLGFEGMNSKKLDGKATHLKIVDGDNAIMGKGFREGDKDVTTLARQYPNCYGNDENTVCYGFASLQYHAARSEIPSGQFVSYLFIHPSDFSLRQIELKGMRVTIVDLDADDVNVVGCANVLKAGTYTDNDKNSESMGDLVAVSDD